MKGRSIMSPRTRFISQISLWNTFVTLMFFSVSVFVFQSSVFAQGATGVPPGKSSANTTKTTTTTVKKPVTRKTTVKKVTVSTTTTLPKRTIKSTKTNTTRTKKYTPTTTARTNVKKPTVKLPSVTIKDVWYDTDVENEDGETGLRIHVQFDADNLRGIDCGVAAYFHYMNGNRIEDTNEEYDSVDGQVAVWRAFNPGYLNATYDDYDMFIPYSELEVGSGRQNLKFFVQIYRQSGPKMATSEWVEFTADIPRDSDTNTNLGAKFNRIWAEQNAYEDGQSGMRIHVNLNVFGMKNKEGGVAAYFNYPNGGKLRDTNQRYYSTDGQVTVWKKITPGYDNTIYEDLQLFIPYREIEGGARNGSYKFNVQVYEIGGDTLEVSDWQNFTCTGCVGYENNGGGNATASIERVWVDYNVTENGRKGMKIHVKFNVNGMKGEEGGVAAYFYCADDNSPLMSKNGRYEAVDKQVTAYDSITPGYENTVYNDYDLFMPYDEIEVGQHVNSSGKANLKFIVKVYQGSKFLAVAQEYRFSFTP